ncbi:MAG: hypothetical protein OCC49_02170 [Fibrobacterales bacterium]
MRIISLLLLLFCFIAGTLSCTDSTISQEFTESKTTGSVDLTLKDFTTRTSIDSAKVTWVVDDITYIEWSDSLGHITISDLPRGIYAINIEKAGYAAMYRDDINLTSTGSNRMPILGDYDAMILMHKNSATISGILKMEDHEGNKTPTPGITVDLELTGTNGIVTKNFETVTDSFGVYSFTDIPEGIERYNLTTRNFEKGAIEYASLELPRQYNLKSAESVSIPPAVLPVAIPNVTIDIAPKEIYSTESVAIVFSQDIDTTRINRGDITVSGQGTAIAINYLFTVGTKQLTITPTQGTWGETGNYTLRVSLESIDGGSINTSVLFTVADIAQPATVIGFTPDTLIDSVDYDTRYLQATWDHVPNAAGYDIYAKTSHDSLFSKVNTISGELDTMASLSLELSEGKSNQFMIVSYTSNGTSTFEEAPIFSVKDVIAPKIDTIPLVIYTDLNNSTADTAKNVLTESIYISGDIDTTKTPSLNVLRNGDIFVPSFEWSSNKYLIVSLDIPAGKDASLLAEDTLTLFGLTDLAGNALPELQVKKIEFNDISVDTLYTYSGSVIDHDQTVRLEWSEVPVVDAYQIWVKTPLDSTYQYLTSRSSYYDSYNYDLDFRNGGSYSFKILSEMDGQLSGIDNTPELVLRDTVAPRVTSSNSPIPVIGSLINGSSNDTLVGSILLSVSNDIDTTTTPTVVVTNNPAILSVTTEWYSAYRLRVSVSIKAGQNASAITSDVVSLTGLTDASGNSSILAHSIPVSFTGLDLDSIWTSTDIAANVPDVRIYVNEIPSVTSYNFYTKVSPSSSFALCTDITIESGYFEIESSCYDFTDQKITEVKVTTTYKGEESSLDRAPTLILKDTIAPAISTTISSSISGARINNTGNPEAIAFSQYLTHSNDMNNALTTAYLKSNPGLLSVNVSPYSTNRILLDYVVEAGADAHLITQDTLVIKGLIDFAGNTSDSIVVPLSIGS